MWSTAWFGARPWREILRFLFEVGRQERGTSVNTDLCHQHWRSNLALHFQDMASYLFFSGLWLHLDCSHHPWAPVLLWRSIPLGWASSHRPLCSQSTLYWAQLLQSCLTFCNPMDCSPPGSFVHGDSLGKNTGMGSLSLLHWIFPTQGSNPGLPHCRQILYHLSHQRSPR